ncbi:MAG: NAD(P)/FAD-dependent oxidoreductase [Burkholderiales bacterium]
MTTPLDVSIVGAGVIGVATAIYLQREGHRVTLIDRGGPGEGTSFGNAGSLAPGSIIPLALPGTIRHVPRWILQPLGPLSLSWRQLPALAPWLYRFWRACDPETVARSARAMRSLNRDCVDTYAELFASVGVADLLERAAGLVLYKSERGFDASAYVRQVRIDNGVKVEVLDAAGIQQIDPALSTGYRWGFALPEGGYVRNPLRVVQSLAQHFTANGGTLITAVVQDFVRARDTVKALVTYRGEISVDRVVIAAGVWSRALAARFGVSMPLTSERGYHIHIPNPGVTVRHQVADGERRFTATAMEGGLRVTGTSEFSGLNAPPEWARTEALARLAPTMLPGINTAGYSRWTGHRPSTPDGRPVIAAAPGYPRVFLAYGHGHWGLMAAPATGQVIADLVAGRTPRIDIAPFHPSRFQHRMR